MGKSDALFLSVWILIPFLGIIGYYSEIMWLFYVAGIFSLLLASALLLFGKLGCFTTLFLVLSCTIGYILTETIWNGLILGSCILLSVVYIFFIILMGSSGISSVKELLKKGKNK